MTEANRDQLDSDPDYRRSHLTRGERYDSVLAAAPFDAYMARLEGEFLRRTIATLFSSGKPRHLDFACGTGRITEVVAPLSAETVGVDVSASMLEQARRKCPAATFVETDVTRGDADLGTFDLVTAFRFFGNAGDDLRASVLEAFRRLLRPNGYLVMNSHRNPYSPAALLNRITGGDKEEMDLHFFKLLSLLRRFGFKVQNVLPIGAWMYRSKLMSTEHDPGHAAKLERWCRFPLLAPIAPNVVIVARRDDAGSRNEQ
jgi:ubiquinone/menaquinone biosynthesis C-methylase UbiE